MTASLRGLVLLFRGAERAGGLDLGDFTILEAEHLSEDFVGVLAEQRRTLHLADRIRQFDRIADREVLAARRMIHLNHRAGLTQRLVRRDLLHRQDRTARNVVLVEDLHGLELGLGQGPLLNALEDLVELRQPRLRRGVFRIGLPGRFADHVADLLPDRGLGDEVDVRVRIFRRALAHQDAARLTTAGVVSGARRRVAERNALTVLAVFGERTSLEALLIAQLHAAEVQHAVLHRGEHLLAAAGARALEKRGDDAECEVQAGAAIADLRAGNERRAVAEAGGRSRAAGALRDVLVDLAVLVWAGAEALHRGDDHARVGLVDVIPGEPHAVERAGREILHHHVAILDQLVEHALALRVLGVDRDRALVVVEHREVERIGVRHVAQLTARDVADAGTLDLDHVGAEPGEKLRAGRARLHVREIEDANALERLAVEAERLRRRLRQIRRLAVALHLGHRPGDDFLRAL